MVSSRAWNVDAKSAAERPFPDGLTPLAVAGWEARAA